MLLKTLLIFFFMINMHSQLVLSDELNYERLLAPVDAPTPFSLNLIREQSKLEIPTIFPSVLQQLSTDTKKVIFVSINVHVLNTADVYKLSNFICNLFENGAYALIAAVSPSSFETYHAYANLFQIPLVTPWFPEKILKPISGYYDHAISMTPDYHKAVSDTIEFYGWKSVIYMYESLDGLLRLEELFSDFKLGNNKFQISHVKQISNVLDALHYLIDLETQNRWSIKYVVLDCKEQLATDILIAHVHDPKLGRRNYHYLVTSLIMDRQWENATEFGSINVTGFSIVNRYNTVFKKFLEIYKINNTADSISAETALYHDAIQVVIKSFKKFVSSNPHAIRNRVINRRRHNATMIDCNPSTTDKANGSIFGSRLLEIMKKMEFEGLTGPIRFNQRGQRQNFTMQIVEIITHNTSRRVAQWSDYKGLTPIVQKPLPLGVPTTFERNRTYVVTLTLKAPFLMKSKEEKEGYFGFYKELLDSIAEKLEMKYTINIVSDGQVGSQNPKLYGIWDGMMGELVRKKVDMALFDMTIERERYVEFSKSFLDMDAYSPKKTANKQPPEKSSFYAAFSKETLICVGLTFIGVSVMLYIIARISPAEWILETRNSPDNDEMQEVRIVNQFSYFNCVWYLISTMMRQDSGMTPISLGVRVISAFWRFSTSLLILFYTVYLISSFIMDKEDVMSSQQRIYGIQSQDFSSFAPTFAIEHDFSENPSWMTNFYNPKNDQSLETCDQLVISWNEDLKEYAVAFPKGSALREGINLAIQSMKNSGEMHRLIIKWFPMVCNPQQVHKQEVHTLDGMAKFVSVIYVVLCLVSILKLIGTCIHNIRQYKNTTLHQPAIELEEVDERPPSRALSHEIEPSNAVSNNWNKAQCARCYEPNNLENVFPVPPAGFREESGCIRRPATVRRAATSMHPPNVELYQL